MFTRPATDVAAKGLRDNPRTIYHEHHQYLLVNWCLPENLEACFNLTFIEEGWYR